MSHARLGPSNHRWPHCPGSVREEARFPDVSGEAAIDGTGSHLLLEMCLTEGADARQYGLIGVDHPEKPEGWLVDDERAERVQVCLDYVKRRVKELEDTFPNALVNVQAEAKADVGGMFGRTDWWGTVDITITALNPAGGLHFIEIIDYKDGRGWVDEVDNSQLLSYCAGQMRAYVGSGPEFVRPFRTDRVGGCRMTIVQPKTSKPIRPYDCSAQAVMSRVEKLAEAARLTDDPDAPCVPGEWCLWCKANPKRGGDCTAALDEAIEKVNFMTTENSDGNSLSLFESVQKGLTDVKALDDTTLADVLDAEAAFLAVFDQLRKEAEERIESGVEVPGYAMQPGRGTRVWNEDAETVEKKLKGKRLTKDDIYPRKLASPAQILGLPDDKLSKSQKQRVEEELVSFKAGKLKLTKVARKQQTAEQMFADVQEVKPLSFL